MKGILSTYCWGLNIEVHLNTAYIYTSLNQFISHGWLDVCVCAIFQRLNKLCRTFKSRDFLCSSLSLVETSIVSLCVMNLHISRIEALPWLATAAYNWRLIEGLYLSKGCFCQAIRRFVHLPFGNRWLDELAFVIDDAKCFQLAWNTLYTEFSIFFYGLFIKWLWAASNGSPAGGILMEAKQPPSALDLALALALSTHKHTESYLLIAHTRSQFQLAR